MATQATTNTKPARHKRVSKGEAALDAAAAPFLWLAQFCLAAAALGSMVTTYIGTKAILGWLAGPQEDVETIALMISALATGLNLVLFAGTIRLLPLYRTGRAKLIGVLVLCLLLVLNVFALTSTSVIGMTGTSARSLYLRDEARGHGLNVYGLSERALAQREFADFIGPDADASCTSAETELRTGRLSGSPGRGPVADALQTICTRKLGIAHVLAENMTASAPLIAEITALSRGVDRVVVNRDMTIEERELSFIEAVRVLEARILELRAADRMNAVRASYQAMEDALSGLEGSLDGLSRGQQVAIRTLIARERASAKAVRDFIAEIEATSLPPLYRTELIPMPSVALRYALSHWPQLGLALLVDLFGPLTAALAWAAAMRRRPQRTRR
ncbi:MAG: hypothetical protein AAF636_18680 [Pseudomonadota bacterium]